METTTDAKTSTSEKRKRPDSATDEDASGRKIKKSDGQEIVLPQMTANIVDDPETKAVDRTFMDVKWSLIAAEMKQIPKVPSTEPLQLCFHCSGEIKPGQKRFYIPDTEIPNARHKYKYWPFVAFDLPECGKTFLVRSQNSGFLHERHLPMYEIDLKMNHGIKGTVGLAPDRHLLQPWNPYGLDRQGMLDEIKKNQHVFTLPKSQVCEQGTLPVAFEDCGVVQLKQETGIVGPENGFSSAVKAARLSITGSTPGSSSATTSSGRKYNTSSLLPYTTSDMLSAFYPNVNLS